MRNFILILLIFNFLLIKATSRNRFIDSSKTEAYKAELENFIDKLYRDSSESLIKYQISFVNKHNEPPLVNSIEINSHIDCENNVLFEAIKITYIPDRGHYFQAELKGEEIDFNVNPFDSKNNDISIVDISAPGWRINLNENHARITNINDVLLNNTIHLVLIVKNQDKYKRRIIDFYNLYGIDFYCKMEIDSNYNFIGYFPNLPFPSIDLPKRINEIYNVFGSSVSKQTQVQNNRILYQGYFVGDINYSDDLMFYRDYPKTHMQFSYGYDFIKNTNKVIVEENKISTEKTLKEIIRSSGNSTLIALLLFALSILVSIFFYLNPRGSRLNNLIKASCRFIFKKIQLWIVLFIKTLTSLIIKILSISLRRRK